MNYYTLRYLIMSIISIIIIVLSISKGNVIYNKLLVKFKNKSFINLTLLFMIILIYKIIWIFPYERIMLNFAKADNIINYFIKNEKILNKTKYS